MKSRSPPHLPLHSLALAAALLWPATSPAHVNVYGPIRSGEVLSAIAYQVRPDATRTSTWQTVLALYRANPDAFVGGSIHQLRVGAQLTVPDAAAVRAIDPDFALAFANDPERDLSAFAAGRAELPRARIEASERPPDMASVTAPRDDLARPSPLAPPRRIPGGNPPMPRDSAPLPDPNRMSQLAPVAAAPLGSNFAMVAIPDRWRVLNSLDLLAQRWWDPYHQNRWKGDQPLHAGGDEFLSISVISDSVYEPRRLPVPTGPQASHDSGSIDIFGAGEQTVLNQNLAVALVYLKGDTTFKPPEWEYHFTPVFNFNRVIAQENRLLDVDPRDGTTRNDSFIGIQELFADYHLRNVSDRYDFDSVRIGIQPFSSDFRGFLFQDNQLALRLFGTRDNNRWQYNLAWIRRLEKDTNSGLNDVGAALRHDDLFVFNLYHQDFPLMGFTSQGLIAWNHNREQHRYYNENGFIERPASIGLEQPRRYDLGYVGYNGDGHFGRLNLTASVYGAFGHENRGTFTETARDIAAGFAAAEASVDQDWMRWRLSLLWSSGDRDPFDGTANGFDSVFENPVFAGADTSFWIRQAVPLVGGGGVTLSPRNGIINDLRSSKDHGQSNFANPGTRLAGVGADFDLLPQLRLSFNANHLWFDDTATLEVARNQAGIDRDIGWDLSLATIWRPLFTQNIVLRVSGAWLLPGAGYDALFPHRTPYSLLANLIVTY